MPQRPREGRTHGEPGRPRLPAPGLLRGSSLRTLSFAGQTVLHRRRRRSCSRSERGRSLRPGPPWSLARPLCLGPVTPALPWWILRPQTGPGGAPPPPASAWGCTRGACGGHCPVLPSGAGTESRPGWTWAARTAGPPCGWPQPRPHTAEGGGKDRSSWGALSFPEKHPGLGMTPQVGPQRPLTHPPRPHRDSRGPCLALAGALSPEEAGDGGQEQGLSAARPATLRHLHVFSFSKGKLRLDAGWDLPGWGGRLGLSCSVCCGGSGCRGVLGDACTHGCAHTGVRGARPGCAAPSRDPQGGASPTQSALWPRVLSSAGQPSYPQPAGAVCPPLPAPAAPLQVSPGQADSGGGGHSPVLPEASWPPSPTSCVIRRLETFRYWSQLQAWGRTGLSGSLHPPPSTPAPAARLGEPASLCCSGDWGCQECSHPAAVPGPWQEAPGSCQPRGWARLGGPPCPPWAAAPGEEGLDPGHTGWGRGRAPAFGQRARCQWGALLGHRRDSLLGEPAMPRMPGPGQAGVGGGLGPRAAGEPTSGSEHPTRPFPRPFNTGALPVASRLASIRLWGCGVGAGGRGRGRASWVGGRPLLGGLGWAEPPAPTKPAPRTERLCPESLAAGLEALGPGMQANVWPVVTPGPAELSSAACHGPALPDQAPPRDRPPPEGQPPEGQCQQVRDSQQQAACRPGAAVQAASSQDRP